MDALGIETDESEEEILPSKKNFIQNYDQAQNTSKDMRPLKLKASKIKDPALKETIKSKTIGGFNAL